MFLYNRLTWLGVGILAIVVCIAFFPMSAEVLMSRKSTRRAKDALKEEESEESARPRFAANLPRVIQVFNSATKRAQLFSLIRLRFFNIVTEIPFWAIGLIMIVLGLINGYFAGESNGVNVWPVTYLMLQVVQGSAALFFYIIATLYAGELIWRQRDVRFDQIHDSLPVGDTTDWLSKFFASALVELVLLSVILV